MSLSRIQKLNLDSTRIVDTESVSLQVSLQTPIVKVPSAYNVAVEKAEIPITRIPLNVLNTPHYILIDYPTDAPDHPVLQKKLNVFWIQGQYRSITEFLDMINKVIHTDLLPTVSCGKFVYDRDNLKIGYEFGDATQRATLALGVEMWMDVRLKYLLEGIPRVFDTLPDPSVYSDTDMYKVTWNKYIAGKSGLVTEHQLNYLLPRLFGFKSIRITSSLPTRPYVIFNQLTYNAVPSNLLSEIMMDSQNYVEGRTNQLYIPLNVSQNEMIGVSEITDFTLWFYIHYKNGVDIPLTADKNEYLSVTLSFTKVLDP